LEGICNKLADNLDQSESSHSTTLDKLAAAMQTIKTMAEGTDLA